MRHTFFTLTCALLFGGGAFAFEITEPSEVPMADVVLVGELHDNPDHHLWQADLVAQLQPAAVVFEMLSPEQAEVIAGFDRSDQDGLEAALNWSATGWPSFAFYHPIIAASDARIFGAALPRETVRSAVMGDAAALFGPDAAQYGLTDALDPPEQSTREAYQMAAHCDAMPESMMGGMVAAQRLRDAAFSRTVLEALQVTGGPVVMIAGNGHVRKDWGMPVYLKRAAPEVSLVSIGQLEDLQDGAPFDFWTVAPAPDRNDPCAAFR